MSEQLKDEEYIVTIKNLNPGNTSITNHAIPVTALNQIEAASKAMLVWEEGTAAAHFASVEIKKVSK